MGTCRAANTAGIPTGGVATNRARMPSRRSVLPTVRPVAVGARSSGCSCRRWRGRAVRNARRHAIALAGVACAYVSGGASRGSGQRARQSRNGGRSLVRRRKREVRRHGGASIVRRIRRVVRTSRSGRRDESSPEHCTRHGIARCRVAISSRISVASKDSGRPLPQANRPRRPWHRHSGPAVVRGHQVPPRNTNRRTKSTRRGPHAIRGCEPIPHLAHGH